MTPALVMTLHFLCRDSGSRSSLRMKPEAFDKIFVREHTFSPSRHSWNPWCSPAVARPNMIVSGMARMSASGVPALAVGRRWTTDQHIQGTRAKRLIGATYSTPCRLVKKSKFSGQTLESLRGKPTSQSLGRFLNAPLGPYPPPPGP